MGASTFLSRMHIIHVQAKKIHSTKYARFVFTVIPERVNMDCQYLSLIVTDAMTDFGKRIPVCKEPSIISAYAKDSREIISCKGCIYDKPNA